MPHPTSDSAYGIWSLNEVRDAVRGDNWPSLGFDEFAALGTPDRTVTTIPSSFGPDGTGQQDFTYAVDISSFNSSDDGVIFEVGAFAAGFSVQMNAGSLYVQSPSLTDTTTSMSQFDGQTGTLYVSIDYSGGTYDIYWISLPSSNLVVSDTLSGDYEGSDITGVGAIGNAIAGTDYGTYEGTITEFRSWADTYYDFSTV